MLSAYWQDPTFEASQLAFYYIRVIQIPSPRWTAYDQKRYGIKMPDNVPMTVTDRAYTSPIWYTPSEMMESLLKKIAREPLVHFLPAGGCDLRSLQPAFHALYE